MKVYLVGGAVRDELLGRPVVEHDYVVVGATPEQLIAQGYQQVGRDFPVFLHPKSKDEYALARTERKQGQGYTGFICDFNPTVTLEEDLIRRDLTVNAIAKDSDGTLIDPYDGIADINNRVLRHVSEAFAEDPLRVLRVARFAARYCDLGFTIAEETTSLMKSMVANGELKTLTKERVWIEIEKTLKDGRIDIFSQVLQQINALDSLSHELAKAWQKTQPSVLSASLANVLSDDSACVTRFCLWLSHVNTQSISEIVNELKIPNLYADTLRNWVQLQALFQQQTLSAEQLYAIYTQTDAFRRKERLDQLMAIAKASVLSEPNLVAKVAHGFEVCLKITAQSLISEGITGKEIKPALDAKRIQALSSL